MKLVVKCQAEHASCMAKAGVKMICRIESKLSFMVGFVIGVVASAVAVLYAAQLASPFWVIEEDIGRTFELEQKAKKAYKKGNIEEALTKISTAAEIRRMMPNAEKKKQWPFAFPSVSITLLYGGIGRYGHSRDSQLDTVQLIYACSEVYLFNEKNETQANNLIDKLKINHPEISKEWCLNIASEFLNGV